MEERLLLLFLYVVTYVEWISFYCVVLKEELSKPTKKNLIVFLLLLTLRVVGILFWGHTYILFDIVWIAFCCCFFSMTIFQALKKWLIVLAVVSVLEMSIACVLKAYSLYVAQARVAEAIECAFLVTVTVWVYAFLVGRKLSKEHLTLPHSVWRLLIGVVVVIMLMMVYFSFLLQDIPNPRMVKTGSVLILIGGLSVCGMIVAVIYYFNTTARYRLQNEMLEKYNEQQREYFVKLLEKEKHTKRFRHDIINHLLVIQDIAIKGKTKQLEEYICDLLQDINSEQHKQYDVGNEVVNTILNYYLLPIKDICDIKIIGYMGELEKITQKDLCTIISNIIKNAVEAIQKTDDINKEIVVEINCGEKCLSIKVENTMNNDIIVGENGLPQTSKFDKDDHSIGLLNTKTVVERYNGIYKISLEKGKFITQIYLKK